MEHTSKEEAKEIKKINYKSISRDARAFMRNCDTGVLSTLSESDEKYPFGSVCPFFISDEGEVVIMTSDIAIHTKNMNANPNVAFTVFDMLSKHKLASSRVSLSGKATKITEKNDNEKFQNISSHYLQFFPESEQYFKAHKFDFYAITPKFVHYIKTFGSIYTYSAIENWPPQKSHWNQEQANFAIDHMNKDHKSSLFDYAKKFLNIKATNIELKSVDVEGFHMIVDGKIKYINFYSDATEPDSLRKEFVALLKK